jgi:hypothetical protein
MSVARPFARDEPLKKIREITVLQHIQYNIKLYNKKNIYLFFYYLFFLYI